MLLMCPLLARRVVVPYKGHCWKAKSWKSLHALFGTSIQQIVRSVNEHWPTLKTFPNQAPDRQKAYPVPIYLASKAPQGPCR